MKIKNFLCGVAVSAFALTFTVAAVTGGAVKKQCTVTWGKQAPYLLVFTDCANLADFAHFNCSLATLPTKAVILSNKRGVTVQCRGDNTQNIPCILTWQGENSPLKLICSSTVLGGTIQCLIKKDKGSAGSPSNSTYTTTSQCTFLLVDANL